MDATLNHIKNNKPTKEKKKRVDRFMEFSEDDDELVVGYSANEDDKKKRVATGPASTKKGSGGGGASSMKSCQADKCSADLSDAKPYHRRHKVCEYHAKAQMVVVVGIRQRFCQQCSRFHDVTEFDEAKRSCRRRLAGHNERRRKNPTHNSQAEGSSSIGRSSVPKGSTSNSTAPCIAQFKENANYKHFHES